jgi:hypothetical protein
MSPSSRIVELDCAGGLSRPDRRGVLFALGGLAGLYTVSSAAVLAACRDNAPGSPVSASPVQPGPGGPPSLGAHSLAYNRDGVAVAPLSTTAMTTQPAGSTLLVSVGRGVVSTHSRPTDSHGNAYVQVDIAHVYTRWPSSGTALYSCQQARGGTGHGVTVAKPIGSDETTLSVVEIVNGGRLLDAKWSEVAAGRPLTSPAVTTSGPALLVAWWWGDADVRFDKTATPDNGFTVIDEILLEGALVQCAVAVRQVEAAGTYEVTWTSTPLQGAQLWIAAVQSAPAA